MIHRFVVALSLPLLAVSFLSSANDLRADDTLEGKLEVARDRDGKLTSARILVDEGAVKKTVKVMLDDLGRQLAESLDGRDIAASGALSDQDGQAWLTVKKFELTSFGTVSWEEDEEGNERCLLSISEPLGEFPVIQSGAGAGLKGKDGQTFWVRAGVTMKDGSPWLNVTSAVAVTRIQGYLEPREDEEGNVTGAQLVVFEGESETRHQIRWDARGRKLADEMGYEDTIVSGALETRAGKTWFVVQKFERPAPPEEEEEPGDDEDDEGWDEED